MNFIILNSSDICQRQYEFLYTVQSQQSVLRTQATPPPLCQQNQNTVYPRDCVTAPALLWLSHRRGRQMLSRVHTFNTIRTTTARTHTTPRRLASTTQNHSVVLVRVFVVVSPQLAARVRPQAVSFINHHTEDLYYSQRLKYHQQANRVRSSRAQEECLVRSPSALLAHESRRRRIGHLLSSRIRSEKCECVLVKCSVV